MSTVTPAFYLGIEYGILEKADIREQLDSAYRQNTKRQNEKVTRNRYMI